MSNKKEYGIIKSQKMSLNKVKAYSKPMAKVIPKVKPKPMKGY